MTSQDQSTNSVDPDAPPFDATESSDDTSNRFSDRLLATMRPFRPYLLAAYVFYAAWHWHTKGIPLQRLQVGQWLLGGVLILRFGYSWREFVRLLQDWIPLALLLAAYDMIRGIADTTFIPIQRQSVITIEEALFGSPVPTVRWQERFVPSTGPVQWWELYTSMTYFSHFVFSFLLLAVLWVASYPQFRAFRRRFLVITIIGLTGYLLLPTAPPWMSGQDGLIDPVRRIGLRGFRTVGWHTADIRFTYWTDFSNRVAAMPSLHGGYSMLISLFLMRFVPNWAKPLLLLYPALMLFTLVVGGEHFVVDVIAGFGCALAAMAICGAWERRSDRRSNNDLAPI